VAFHQSHCPCCQNIDVIKHGITPQGKQRYRGKNPRCSCQTFLVEYSHHGRVPEVKQQILEMTLNGSGIRDIARVLHSSPTTVIEELQKKSISSSTSIPRPFNTSIQVRSLVRSTQGKKQKSMKCGVLLGRNPNNDGSGMRLTIRLESYEPTCWEHIRTKSSDS
jgi:transposase-like protein